MKRKNSTRNALFTSIISMLLCVSMLVGTTFAWFTDEVESGLNKITAGNLDVDVLTADGKSIQGIKTLFNKVDRWEPGALAYENLTVVNLGNLALKYQLKVNFDKASDAKNGKTLADALKVAVVPGGVDASNREALIANLTAEGKWQDLVSFTQSGKLDSDKGLLDDAETADTYGIVIYWEPTAEDNDFNMNNADQGTVLTIDLGIELFATQLEAEEDSFGDDYDDEAEWLGGVDTNWYFENPEATEFAINSAEELAGLAALVNGTATSPIATFAANGDNTIKDNFQGQTIKLSGNIDLANQGWTPIGTKSNAFKGTFDGQGYTISNLSIKNPEASNVGLFGYAVNANIQNVKIENVNLHAYYAVAAICGTAYSGCKISNCHVSGDISIVADYAYAAGITSNGYVTVSGCSVIAETMGAIEAKEKTMAGGIVGWMGESKTTGIFDCHVKNLEISAWTSVGAITGLIHYGNTIEGCSAENIALTKTRVDGHPAIGMASGNWVYNATNNITIKDNSFKNITLTGTAVAVESADILHGSEYSGNLTSNLILSGNTSEKVTNNLVTGAKVADGLLQKEDGTYLIYNASGLQYLSGTKLSGTYELIADINLDGAEFKAMSAWYKTVIFNGKGHTISNAKVVSGDNDNGTEQASMFFVSTKGSLTVSDLTLKDITVTTKNIDNGYAAAVIGYCEGAAVLNNVDVVNANITGSKSSGMLVGHLTGTGSLTAADCDVSGAITLSDFEANGHYAGKYIGTLAGPATLTDCTAKVTLGGNLHANNIGDVYGRKTATGNQTIDGKTAVADTAAVKDALANGEDVILVDDVAISKADAGSNGYGATGVHVAGNTLDGNGNSLGVNAWATWDSAINITSGTIKNLTVNSGMRGIFINHNSDVKGKVYLENVVIDGTVYTISCDQGKNQGLTATNSTFNGWTSYAATLGDAKFVDCSFGEGQGYAYCRPYAPTEFVGCDFEAGFAVDPCAVITFENCTINGEPLTAENLSDLIQPYYGNASNASVK